MVEIIQHFNLQIIAFETIILSNQRFFTLPKKWMALEKNGMKNAIVAWFGRKLAFLHLIQLLANCCEHTAAKSAS